MVSSTRPAPSSGRESTASAPRASLELVRPEESFTDAARIQSIEASFGENGPNGMEVVQAVLRALGRFDREHAAVYFQIVYTALREPMRQALEALIMERQAQEKATFPEFAQKLIDRGEIQGEIKGTRGALLRLVARAGITLSDDERARVDACTDLATLERWIDNVLGAETAADVLT
jgi:hypothetical protein